MKIYQITHSADLDGMASAALMRHYYKVPLNRIFFTNYDGKIFKGAVSVIKSLKGRGDLLLISDFGMNAKNVKPMKDALQGFKERGNYVIWLDHHPWTEHETNEIAKVCDILVNGEMASCGTELVYKFLCRRDAFGDRIVAITHLADFVDTCFFVHRDCFVKQIKRITKKVKSKSDVQSAREERIIRRLGSVIKELGRGDSPSSPGLRKVVDLLSSGQLEAPLIKKIEKRYIEETAPYRRELLGNAKVYGLNGIKVAIGFSKKINNQEACMTMQEKLKSEVAIYINYGSGHCSVRSDVTVDSSGISRALGGGGHPQASGFSIEPSQLTAERREKVTKKILAVAKKRLRRTPL